jgi:hypothetical protein
LSVVIFVSLRTTANAEAPWAPILLASRLRARGGEGNGERVTGCQGVLTRHSWGGGAPERGHGASLERLAQLGDALGGVGAVAHEVEAAELVPRQAAKVVSGSVNGR